jgi:uncharacterized delta-60 repeat protein
MLLGLSAPVTYGDVQPRRDPIRIWQFTEIAPDYAESVVHTGSRQVGFVSETFDIRPPASGIAVQDADGKIVVAADSTLSRYLPDGRVDQDFGVGGTVQTGLGAGFAKDAASVAIAPPARSWWPASPAPAALPARTSASGDTSTPGHPTWLSVIRGWPPPISTGASTGPAAWPFSPTGGSWSPGMPPNPTAPAVISPSPGTPAPGCRTRPPTAPAGAADFGFALALQPGGEIVVAGQLAAPGGTDENIGLVRYTADGELDPAFHEGGWTVVDFGVRSGARGVAVDAAGAVVLAGSVSNSFSTTGSDIAVARLTADGEPDSNFDSDGRVNTDLTVGAPAFPSPTSARIWWSRLMA